MDEIVKEYKEMSLREFNTIHNRFFTIEDRLSNINNTMAEISTTLKLQHASLENHMKRTELLEQSVSILRDEHLKFKQTMKTTTWILSSISVIVGLIISLKSLGFIKI